MKKIYFLCIALVITQISIGQTVIFQETFEAPLGANATTSIMQCTNGTNDYFTISDGSNISAGYSSQEGSFYFAAQDINGTCGGSGIDSITFSNIDMTGVTNYTFFMLVAEDDDGTNQDWDTDDAMFVEISIDGGAFTKVMQFATATPGFNQEPLLDTDLDGRGDSTALTEAFQEFQVDLNNTGTTASIRITFQGLGSGDEDVAIDNIRLVSSSILSTETIISKSAFTMYPNPTNSGIVNIKTQGNEAVKVSVFDILGKRVINTTLNSETLDVSALKTGLYTVKLSQGNNVVTKKLVIN